MPLTPIDPEGARRLLAGGALLIDIRSAAEYRREHIAAARRISPEELAGARTALAGAPAVIFHCLSGLRTTGCAATLAGGVDCDAYVLAGGLAAWKKAGLPVVADAGAPLELQRQVQIAAGGMVLAGVLLGASVTPWFLLLAGFVGAGLVFAGVSGHCGLARLLMQMPWNRGRPQA